MESNGVLQKKALTAIIIFILLFIIAAESAEITNFVYLVPFSLAFFLMLNAAETELHSVSFNFVIPFLYGVISDIIFFKRMFIFSTVFVIFAYITFYLVDYLKLDKNKVFATVSAIYSLILYFFLSTPLWVCLFVFLVGFLQWMISSILVSKILTGKHSGET